MTINNKFNQLYQTNEFAPPGLFKSLCRTIGSILFGEKDEEKSIGLSRFREKKSPGHYEQPVRNKPSLNSLQNKETETINTKYSKLGPQKYTNTKV